MTENDEFDLQEFLPYLLTQAAEETSIAFQAAYKGRYGMLRTEWRVLFHLGIYGPMTAKEIGIRSKTHKTKISRAVAALEKRRFLQREKVASDRRHEKLTLTVAGSRAYRDLRLEARNYDKAVISVLSDDEVRNLRSTLKKLARLE